MSNPNPPLDREAKRRLAVIRHVEEVSRNMALSCRYFGVSRQAYYTWSRRYQADGVDGLRARSRRPKTSPGATHVEIVGKSFTCGRTTTSDQRRSPCTSGGITT
jgi:transposase